MVNDKKIKVLKEYFIRKGEVDKNQLTTFGEHKTAVASLPLFKSVKNLINHKITESAKNSLKAKADKSGISLYTLKEVYRRGVCDWNANMTKTAQQCGFDRVNSFIAKGRTYFNEDYDLVEQLNRKTLSPEELAKKHNLSLKTIQAEIAKGEKVEMEHTKNIETANQIAREHIKENPKYYEALKKMENKFVKIANENNKIGLSNFIEERIDIHNKHGWMLRSILKGS